MSLRSWAGVSRLNIGKLIATFTKVRPRLEAVAQARTGNRATAEDIMQDVWIRLENARPEQVIDNPVGYITRVANNLVSDHMRKERRRAGIDSEVADLLCDGDDAVTPERALIGRERLEAVRAALDDLPEKTRRIFLMNRIEGIPHRRIAEMLGVSDEAVYYHIRRALERLAVLRDDLAG